MAFLGQWKNTGGKCLFAGDALTKRLSSYKYANTKIKLLNRDKLLIFDY